MSGGRVTRDGRPPEVRVLIVDDHPVFRRGLSDILATEPGIAVCGEAESVDTARQAIAARSPDVAVVDLALGDEDGLDLVSTVARSHPNVRVLVLSGHDERLHADRALKAGALGYVMKDATIGQMIDAIRRVASGKPFVSPDIAERILSGLGGSHRRSDQSPLERLTDRERRVLTLMGRGIATREIAAQLRLSVKTVESHYAHIKEKLGVRNGRELMRAAVRWADDGDL